MRVWMRLLALGLTAVSLCAAPALAETQADAKGKAESQAAKAESSQPKAQPQPKLDPGAAAEAKENAKLAKRIAAAARIVQSSIEAARANDFERWLSHFSADALFMANDKAVYGRESMRQGVNLAHAMGRLDSKVSLTSIEILDSGWTGDRIYTFSAETYSDGIVVEYYSEYEIERGKIVGLYMHL